MYFLCTIALPLATLGANVMPESTVPSQLTELQALPTLPTAAEPPPAGVFGQLQITVNTDGSYTLTHAYWGDDEANVNVWCAETVKERAVVTTSGYSLPTGFWFLLLSSVSASVASSLFTLFASAKLFNWVSETNPQMPNMKFLPIIGFCAASTLIINWVSAVSSLIKRNNVDRLAAIKATPAAYQCYRALCRALDYCYVVNGYPYTGIEQMPHMGHQFALKLSPAQLPLFNVPANIDEILLTLMTYHHNHHKSNSHYAQVSTTTVYLYQTDAQRDYLQHQLGPQLVIFDNHRSIDSGWACCKWLMAYAGSGLKWFIVSFILINNISSSFVGLAKLASNCSQSYYLWPNWGKGLYLGGAALLAIPKGMLSLEKKANKVVTYGLIGVSWCSHQLFYGYKDPHRNTKVAIFMLAVQVWAFSLISYEGSLAYFSSHLLKFFNELVNDYFHYQPSPASDTNTIPLPRWFIPVLGLQMLAAGINIFSQALAQFDLWVNYYVPSQKRLAHMLPATAQLETTLAAKAATVKHPRQLQWHALIDAFGTNGISIFLTSYVFLTHVGFETVSYNRELLLGGLSAYSGLATLLWQYIRHRDQGTLSRGQIVWNTLLSPVVVAGATFGIIYALPFSSSHILATIIAFFSSLGMYALSQDWSNRVPAEFAGLVNGLTTLYSWSYAWLACCQSKGKPSAPLLGEGLSSTYGAVTDEAGEANAARVRDNQQGFFARVTDTMTDCFHASFTRCCGYLY